MIVETLLPILLIVVNSINAEVVTDQLIQLPTQQRNAISPNQMLIGKFTFEQGGVAEVTMKDIEYIPSSIPHSEPTSPNNTDISNNNTTASNDTSIPVVVDNSTTIVIEEILVYLVCSDSAIKQIVVESPNPTSDKSFYFPIFCKNEKGYCKSVDILNNQQHAGNSSAITTEFSDTYDIPTTDAYYFFILQCSGGLTAPLIPSTTTALKSHSFTNPGIDFIKHLDLLHRFRLIFQFACFLAWLVLFAFYLVNYFSVKQSIKLQYLICIVPITRLLYLASGSAFFLYYGINGNSLRVLSVLPDVFVGLNTWALYSLLILMAKGYGVIRLNLSPVEWRGVIACSMFLGAAEALYSAFGWTVGLIVFNVSIYIYIFHTLRVHLETFIYYVDGLRRKYNEDEPSGDDGDQGNGRLMAHDSAHVVNRPWYRMTPIMAIILPGFKLYEPLPKVDKPPKTLSMSEDWDLVGAFEAKLWLLCMVQRIITYFTSVTIIVRLAAFLEIFADTSFVLIASEVTLLIGFAWIAYVYRLRVVFQHVKVPNWVLSTKED